MSQSTTPNDGDRPTQAGPPPAEPLRADGPFPQPFGRYELRQHLGSGGMASVYRAFDQVLERDVALKVPHAHILRHGVTLQRFYREARAAARLYHTNLCQVFDVGEHAGMHYLTMRYVEGRPLSNCRELFTDPRLAADLVRRLALALGEAHRLDVLHRDLKPSNILMTPALEPVVTDFGLALRLGASEEPLTGPCVTVGTPAYMAPEQIRARPGAASTEKPPALGPPCDVYALGVILYELLTGRRPFADTPETWVLLQRVLHEPPPAPTGLRPSLDARLDAICLRAMAKDPAARFASMAALASELADYLRGAGPLSPGEPLPPTVPVAEPPAPTRPLLHPEHFRFAFVGHGQHAPEPAKLRNRLYLDAGNDLRPGVIDHHHLTAYAGSTAGLVLAHPALLDAAALDWRSAEDPFILVLHEQPDLDSVASAYLSIAYLSTGSFPPGARVLANFLDKVDQGCLGLSMANPFSLYSAYLQLVNRLARQPGLSQAERWQASVRAGLEVVAYTLEQVECQGIPLPAVDAFACPGQFGPEDRQAIESDLDRYHRKLAEPRDCARRATLRLPGQFGGTVEVEALLVRDVQQAGDPERCMFFKDWARSDRIHCQHGRGFIALSVFASEGPNQVRRCVLSVTPDSGAWLRGLGDLLDQAEAKRRRQIYGVDDRVTDPASGADRPPRAGYDNADPWYDGRAHGYTIVDAPRSGTRLSADEIEAVFLRFGGSPGEPLPVV
jgi:serine/threonine protein kinase